MFNIVVTLMTCDTVIDIGRRRPNPVSTFDMATRTFDLSMCAEQVKPSRRDRVVVLELCVCLASGVVAQPTRNGREPEVYVISNEL